MNYREPLSEFLKKKIWTRPDNYIPPSPNRIGWRG